MLYYFKSYLLSQMRCKQQEEPWELKQAHTLEPFRKMCIRTPLHWTCDPEQQQ